MIARSLLIPCLGLALSTASALAASDTVCYQARVSPGETLSVRLSSYPATREYPAGPAYGVMKVSLASGGTVYENTANSMHALNTEDEEVGADEEGTLDPKRALADGFFVTYGVDDDQGHAMIQYADSHGSILRARGRPEYSMILVSKKPGCDIYLDNYDPAKCQRTLAPLWRGLRKVRCAK